MDTPDNAHPHPCYEEGGDEWNLLMKKNEFDASLYEYALHLFDVQGQMLEI
jgi:hypothetical protein